MIDAHLPLVQLGMCDSGTGKGGIVPQGGVQEDAIMKPVDEAGEGCVV